MKKYYEYVGTFASIYLGGLDVIVKITDYKEAWGKIRWEVEPVAGDGRIWVENVSHLEDKYLVDKYN